MSDQTTNVTVHLDTSKVPDELKKLEQQINKKGIHIKPTLDTSAAEKQAKDFAKRLQAIAPFSGLLQDLEAFNKMLADSGQNSSSSMQNAEKSAASFEGSLAKLGKTFSSVMDSMHDSSGFSTLFTGLDGFLAIVNDMSTVVGNIEKIGIIGEKLFGTKNLGKRMPVHTFQMF